MTIKTNTDPEIVVDAITEQSSSLPPPVQPPLPSPSAPPPPLPPLATAVPIAASIAQVAPISSSSQYQSSCTTDVESQQSTGPLDSSKGSSIVTERTVLLDGSIDLKVTTTSCQPNGYQGVKVEHFHIPTSEADNVDTTSGNPPPSLYLKRMEQHVLPPGTSMDEHPEGAEQTGQMPTVAAGPAVAAYWANWDEARQKRCKRLSCILVAAFIVFIVRKIIGASKYESSRNLQVIY